MDKQILIRPLARQDLLEQFDFIAQDNESAAIRFVDMTEKTFRQLLEMPEMGSPQQFRNPKLTGVRRWRVHDFEKHLIFYQPLPEGIEILRILYATRDIESLLKE